MALTSTRLTPRGPNKFPATQLFLLALVRLAEPIAITSIFPYAWKFVLHFNVGDKSNASFYAGLLISAFSLTESLTGVFWGTLSDKLGRKPVLLLGCIGTLSSLLVVGFSMNIWMALAGRFLGGALNGNIGVIQTMVGELVINPDHEPKAYAIMPFVWSVGTMIGPCIGGFFASPADNFPDTFSKDGLFGRFPYLLPNLICAAFMGVSVLTGYLFLEETHPDMQPWSTPQDLEDTNAKTPLMPAQASSNTPAVNLEDASYGTFNAVDEEAIVEEWDIKPDGTSRPASISSGSGPKVFNKRIIMLNIALGIFTYHSMTYDSLQPIFFQDDRVPSSANIENLVAAATASDSGSLAGGLGLSIQQVGVIMFFNGLIALVVQGVIFPPMADWLGIWKLFIVTAIGHPLAYFVVPFLALVPVKMVFPAIYACLTVRNLFSIMAYPVLLILIKEAAVPGSLGKINGLAASVGAASRMLASPVAGYLYGIGMKMDFTAIAWWASALVAVVGTIQAFFVNRVKDGPQHRIRGVAPCRFVPDEGREHRPSVVHIKIHDTDSGYNSADERTPFASRVV
ncbi:Major facilitator superfamily multidrug transporter mfsB [Fulvia fulva]|nr:Major facilitator superfamily multidrug transporter mfsB [Fulvia fulva]KAK4620648.1 Major facilitator superfamily multidrug transporter mfsB [Fulvia fulva]WPV17670.1 Major facilitator superfamily multidrug transporter mfsB [Fulvia fulva]WPV31885.1 Major facilitator superfamily multidrug transporter mfsB [Fulvia fulva]